MRPHAKRVEPNGFTLLEAAIALTLGAIVMVILVPAFSNTLQRARANAAVRQIMSELREARSRAIATGWEYRIVGYRTGASGSHASEYRVLARRSGAVGWPDENGPAFESDTQLVRKWKNLASEYPGVEIGAGNARYELTFDARGSAPGAAGSFNPVTVTGHDGTQQSISVSVVGGITVE